MPFAVRLLGLAVFTQGTSEFMLAGLLTDIAADIGVSIPDAGLLTSAFAVGMVIGAPLMALLSSNWPRRRSLVLFLMVFIAVHILAATADSYPILLATRVIAAVANAGFWATALATATALVGPGAKARATSTVVGGVTLACIAGVPAGAVLGQYWGWRSAFWAVAVLSVPALVAILRSVPDTRPETTVGARDELRAVRNGSLAAQLGLCALVQGETFCAFTYLGPILTGAAGAGQGWVPVILAVFGIGSFGGVTVAGRVADRAPRATMLVGTTALVLGWTTFALTAAHPVAAMVLAFVQGALAFGVGSTLISRVLAAAPDAVMLAGGLATAAFNVGATVGPWLGGTVIDAGHGYGAPLWISVAMSAPALAGVWWLYGRRARMPENSAEPLR